jgi:hypothetical protein
MVEIAVTPSGPRTFDVVIDARSSHRVTVPEATVRLRA